jgi:hypothetical protein
MAAIADVIPHEEPVMSEHKAPGMRDFRIVDPSGNEVSFGEQPAHEPSAPTLAAVMISLMLRSNGHT